MQERGIFLFHIAAVKNDRLPCVQARQKGCCSHERDNTEPFTTHSRLSNSAFVTAYRHSDTAMYMMLLVN